MSLLGGWILAPLALAILVWGLGLLVERLGGVRLPGAAVPATGLAALIVGAGVPASWDATAEAAVPLVAAAAAAGLVLGRPWADARRVAWRWPAAVAALAFVVYAAPSLGSGQGSIAGYVSLDDSATWLAHVDHVLEQGRDLGGLEPSSYQRTLETWLGGGYPVGGFLGLGLATSLTGQDPAGAYQAVIALLAAICALGLYACARALVPSRSGAAVAAVLAVQASLLFGYAQWGGIKEVAVAALLPGVAIAAGRGAWVALALGAGALAGVLGLNGLAWGAPALAAGAAIAWARRERLRPARAAALAALLTAALAPALVTADFLRQTTEAGGGIAAADDLGNLVAPLSALQAVGPWPAGDFRVDPEPLWLAAVLAVAVLAAAAAGVALAARRRAAPLVVLALVATAGAVPAVAVGSPWVDAKAYAIISPAIFLAACALLAAGLGAAGALRVAAAAALGALAAAVAWSTLLAARDVQVAPRERLAELREAAAFLGDRGPLLLLDYEIYGDRHFLREAAPEGASDLRVRQVRLVDGTTPPDLTTVEVDDIATPDLWAYRTIVRRRTPVGSRPPAAFRRTWAGESWEVWERDPATRPPLRRLPLGTPLAPAAVPACARVRALARERGIRTLAAVARTPPVVVDLREAAAPAAWATPEGVRPRSDGTATLEADVPAGGDWRLWVGGSVRGELVVTVGGAQLGSRRHELAHAGQWLRYGTTAVPTGGGRVRLRLEYARGARPGRGASDDAPALGPVALTPPDAEGPFDVITVPAADHRRLCDGRAYDWIEASGAAARGGSGAAG